LQPFCKKVNKVISSFEINIHGLENKTYEFEFEGGNTFFEAFEQDIVSDGKFKAKVMLEKTDSLIRLYVNIDAYIDMVCDRSLDEFTENFKIEEKYIYKFGDEAKELSEEMEVIPFGTPKINIANLIFDFISLQIPMKKLHPQFRNEDDDDSDGIMVYTDENLDIVKEKSDDNVDPRWAALLKLKNQIK
jgi:uncharacterized metal-binding protein YceD (DUF177 family)